MWDHQYQEDMRQKKKLLHDHNHSYFLLRLLRPQLYEENRVFKIFF